MYSNTFHFDLFCQLAGVGVRVNEKVAAACLDSIAQLKRGKPEAGISCSQDLTFITSSQLSNYTGTRSLVLWLYFSGKAFVKKLMLGPQFHPQYHKNTKSLS